MLNVRSSAGYRDAAGSDSYPRYRGTGLRFRS